MFDPEVRKILGERLALVWADESGKLLEQRVPGASCFVVLGPVPLPLTLGTRTHVFQWYTFSRWPERLAEAVTVDDVLSRYAKPKPSTGPASSGRLQTVP